VSSVLDIVELAGGQVTNGKAVADAAKEGAEVVDPGVVLFAGAGQQEITVKFSFGEEAFEV
jgi:hypothetical protein